MPTSVATINTIAATLIDFENTAPIARAALDRGARVILVSGPVSLSPPIQAELVRVETAEEMKDSVLRLVPESSVVIMAAAVADYRPAEVESKKIKKSESSVGLELVRNEDILKAVTARRRGTGKPSLLVGFSAETGPPETEARRKLHEKDLDLIVANDVALAGAGFDSETNIVTLIDRSDRIESFPMLPKPEAAERILDRVHSLLKETPHSSGKKSSWPAGR